MERIISMGDALLIGGVMANTFIKAEGYEIGDSLFEESKLDVARDLVAKAQNRGLQFLLPTDVVIADRLAADATYKVVSRDDVPKGWRILNIGPMTVEAFRETLPDAQTIVWNGPLGVAEMPASATGTDAIIAILSNRTQ